MKVVCIDVPGGIVEDVEEEETNPKGDVADDESGRIGHGRW